MIVFPGELRMYHLEDLLAQLGAGTGKPAAPIFLVASRSPEIGMPGDEPKSPSGSLWTHP
jgi:hypothetical protein